MERQEAVECFTREAEPVLEEGKKLFYRELQEKTEQLSAKPSMKSDWRLAGWKKKK